jgi:hypothetical protein
MFFCKKFFIYILVPIVALYMSYAMNIDDDSYTFEPRALGEDDDNLIPLTPQNFNIEQEKPMPPAPQTIVAPQHQLITSYNNSETNNSAILDETPLREFSLLNGTFTFKLTHSSKKNNQLYLTYALDAFKKLNVISETNLSLSYIHQKLNVLISSTKLYRVKQGSPRKSHMWSASFDSPSNINYIILLILNQDFVFTVLNKQQNRCSFCNQYICKLKCNRWPRLIYFEDGKFRHLECLFKPINYQPQIFKNNFILTNETVIVAC